MTPVTLRDRQVQLHLTPGEERVGADLVVRWQSLCAELDGRSYLIAAYFVLDEGGLCFAGLQDYTCALDWPDFLAALGVDPDDSAAVLALTVDLDAFAVALASP